VVQNYNNCEFFPCSNPIRSDPLRIGIPPGDKIITDATIIGRFESAQGSQCELSSLNRYLKVEQALRGQLDHRIKRQPP
jgi:hypothetical protein